MPPFIPALIGLFGFTLLPGVALLQRRRPFVEQLGSAVAISVALNSFLVMLLVLSKTYTLVVGWIWLTILVGMTLLLRREWAWIRSRVEVPALGTAAEASSALLVPVLAIVAYKSFALPFFAWDSIASWNRWARAFALDRDFFSATEFFHPQYLSWGISFPYVLSGDTTQEPSAHGFAFFCFLILWAGVWRLSTCFSVPGALACAAVMVPLSVSSYAGTGYSDIAASGFSCLALALTLEAFSTSLARGDPVLWRSSRNRALLAGLAAGTAFHYKLLAPLGFGALLLGLVVLPGRSGLGRRLRLAVLSGLAGAAVIAPWILSSSAALTDPLLHYVTTGIHGDASRIGIFVEGAWVLVAGTTAFKSPFVDVSVFLAGFTLFIVGSRRSREASALGGAAVLGTLVWMATANYDTRALMPFQIAAIVLSLAGLEAILHRVRNRRFRHSIVLSLQVTCLLAYLIPQFAPDFRVGPARAMDWQPGRHWIKASPLTARTQKLRFLQPALADLAAWHSEHPDPAGSIWTNPLLLAELDPAQVDSRINWMGKLEWEGEVRWQQGDLLLVCDFDHDTPKLSYPVIDELVGLSPSTWGPWVVAADEREVIRLQDEYESLKVYSILAEPY